jgi:hypothetical protein
MTKPDDTCHCGTDPDECRWPHCIDDVPAEPVEACPVCGGDCHSANPPRDVVGRCESAQRGAPDPRA